MKFAPKEHQRITDIIKDELEEAVRRIEEQVSRGETVPLPATSDRLTAVRRFYEDLVEKAWTQADEDCLDSLGDMSEEEIKRTMREGFRRSPVYPVPNFASLLNVLRKGATGAMREWENSSLRSGAVSAADRERLSNLLFDELAEAAQEIASRLDLNESASRLVREQLETAQGQIISRFTPLV
jgi:hypothetical protein